MTCRMLQKMLNGRLSGGDDYTTSTVTGEFAQNSFGANYNFIVLSADK